MSLPLNGFRTSDSAASSMNHPSTRVTATTAVVALAVATRLIWIMLVPNLQWGDTAWYDEAARVLATTGELRFPDGHSSRAWFPPGWPALLACAYAVFGAHGLVLKWLNLTLASLTVLFAILLTARIWDRRAGLMAGLLLAVLPGQIAYVGTAQYETFLATLVTLALWLSVTSNPRREGAVRRHHLLGVVLAWAVLTRPVLLLLPLITGVFLVRQMRRWTAAIVPAAYVIPAVSAWTARNAVVLDAPVFVASSNGYNLWVGNNPRATGAQPLLSDHDLAEACAGAPLGEVARDRCWFRRAAGFMRDTPMKFIGLIPRRIAALWRTDTAGLYLSLFHAPMAGAGGRASLHPAAWLEAIAFRAYAATLVLAAAGIVASRADPRARLLLAFVLYWTSWAAVTFGTDRHHCPVMPILCAFAGRALSCLTSWCLDAVGGGE